MFAAWVQAGAGPTSAGLEFARSLEEIDTARLARFPVRTIGAGKLANRYPASTWGFRCNRASVYGCAASKLL